jgi:hypothetical protein
MKAARQCLRLKCPCQGCEAMRDVAARMWTPEPWVPNPGEWIGVPGMSGMGKSTFGKAVMAFLLEEGINQFGWDPAREMSVMGTEREDAPLGPMTLQVTVSELEDDPGLLRKVKPGTSAVAVAIVPDEEFPTRQQRADEFVRAMNLLLPNKPDGQFVLHIEEAGLLEDNAAAEMVQVEIATTWRKYGGSGFWYTQSTSMVPDKARRQWRKLVSFAQRDANDLQALSKLVAPRFAAAVKRLQEYQCVFADRMNCEQWDSANDDVPEEAGAEDAASAA